MQQANTSCLTVTNEWKSIFCDTKADFNCLSSVLDSAGMHFALLLILPLPIPLLLGQLAHWLLHRLLWNTSLSTSVLWAGHC